MIPGSGSSPEEGIGYPHLGFPGGSDGKESTCNAGDLGSVLGWEDPQEEGVATHSSILAWRVPMNTGACWGCKESDTTE